MKTVEVTIKGINPLLIHRFGEAAEQAGNTRKKKARIIEDTRAEALKVANRNPATGTHYISPFAVQLAIATAGTNHRQTGSRKSMTTVVQSAVRVVTDSPDELTILVDDEPATDASIVVDARPVTIPATRGRIMRYRPKYERWTMRFMLEIDETLIDVSTVHMLLTEAGVQCGIGDFRPQRRGPFGTFRVTSWTENARALAAE